MVISSIYFVSFLPCVCTVLCEGVIFGLVWNLIASVIVFISMRFFLLTSNHTLIRSLCLIQTESQIIRMILETHFSCNEGCYCLLANNKCFEVLFLWNKIYSINPHGLKTMCVHYGAKITWQIVLCIFFNTEIRIGIRFVSSNYTDHYIWVETHPFDVHFISTVIYLYFFTILLFFSGDFF